MIKKLLFLPFFIFLAIWLGVKIAADPGYLLMAYGHWSIEMPLWLGVIFFFLANLSLMVLIYFIRRSQGLPSRLRFWSHKRALRIAQQKTNKGLIAVAEGEWKRAEKFLVQAAKVLENPLINYLAAAQAAQGLSAYDRRDLYLRKAHEANPDAEIAIGLTQAQLQLNYKQYEQALATLKHLKELAPQHQFILKLLKKMYLILNDWQGLQDILPKLKKLKIITSNELDELEKQIFLNLLKQKIQAEPSSVEDYFNQLPKSFRLQPEFVSVIANFFLENQLNDKADSLLKSALKHQFHEELIYLYGKIKLEDTKSQIAFLESLLKSRPQNSALCYVLGQLYSRSNLYGKAKQVLEMGLMGQTNREFYLELAQVYEAMNQRDEALRCYRKFAEFDGDFLS